MEKILTKLKLVDVDGTEKTIEVSIEEPKMEAADEFSCLLKIEPKMPNHQKIFGVSEQQAFTLAVGICDTVLSSLTSKGANLFYSDGRKYSGSIEY